MWGTRLSLAVGFSAALIAASIGAAIGIIAGLFRRPHRQPDHARRRYADGLSLYPAGSGHRRGPRPRPDERADRGCRRQRAVLRAQHPRHHRGHRAQGIRRCGETVGPGPFRHHHRRDPAQRPARHRHRHVHHRGLDDPGDRRAVVPRPRQPAAAGRSRIDAGRGAGGADHLTPHLDRSRRDDPDHRDVDQPAGRRRARCARSAPAFRCAVAARWRPRWWTAARCPRSAPTASCRSTIWKPSSMSAAASTAR